MFTGHDPKCPFDNPGLVRVCVCGLLMETRAIEREKVEQVQITAWRDGYNTAKGAADAVFTGLRAQVEALAGYYWDNGAVRRSGVLALLDGDEATDAE